jgi:predicted dehydrogenase
LLAGAEVDAVVAASPVTSHLDDATRAAAAGVAVLVEKPPAPDASGARDLAVLRPAPWAAFNRRFEAGALAARDRVPPTGDLDIRLEIAYRRRSWRAITVHDDALLDLGPHLIDWARWLTRSDVIEVRDAVVTDERADFELTLARGRAHVRASTDRLHRELIDVSDATGARVARHRVGGPSAAIVARFRRGPHPLVTTLRAQLDAFARAMVGGDAGNLGTADDAAAVMTVVDAVRASAASGAPISVRERVAP